MLEIAMTTVNQLLDSKGHQVWSVNADDSVFEAIKLMDEKGVSALIVMQGEKLAGIISERDYARKIILKGRSSHTTPVKEIMSRNVICTAPGHQCSTSMAIMNKHKIRHLPVLQENMIIGMISIGDLVKNIIDEQRDTIENLEHAVSWSESY
jgi:CBS domain-containing protein